MTRKELLFGMAEKTNNRIGPANLTGRYEWYQIRLNKLQSLKETEQVRLAKLCSLDRIEWIIEELRKRKEQEEVKAA